MSARRKRTVIRSRKNQDENNRKRRLLVAFLMLILTGVALTTATYAWFSANDAVDTTDIDLKVTAATGISISADALNFGKTISISDIVGFAKEGCSTQGDDTTVADAAKKCKSSLQYPEKLNPVSTVGPVGGGIPRWYLGAIGDKKSADNSYVAEITSRATSENYVTSSTTGNTLSSGDYMAFDFWIRSGADDVKLDIDNATTNISALVDSAGTRDLESGIRIMFVDMGFTTDTSTSERQLVAKNLNSVNPDNWVIYNPYPDKHHSNSLTDTYNTTERAQGYYGVNRAPNFTSDALDRYDKKGNPDGEGTYIPFTYKTLKSHEGETAYDEIFTLINDDFAHYAMAQDSSTRSTGDAILTVNAGITKFRCYIWLEGQDIDVVDDISFSSGIKVNFGFKTTN